MKFDGAHLFLKLLPATFFVFNVKIFVRFPLFSNSNGRTSAPKPLPRFL